MSPDEHSVAPTLSYVIGRLDRVAKAAMAKVIREDDLSVNQYTVLSVLGSRGSLSNAQLARRSFVSPQSMNEVLLALEIKGFVGREDDPNHGRIRKTTLTPKGRVALASCDTRVAAVEAQMTGELSAEECALLHRLMVECVRGLHGGFSKL